MELFPIDDFEIAASTHGAGPDLFLVSGLGGRAVFWEKLVPLFSPEFRVTTHDHRGTGASTKAKIEYSVSQMATDVLRLADCLGVDEFSIVGHSTGGAVAQYLALNAADRIKHVVLSASWPGPSPYFSELFQIRSEILEKIGADAYLTDGVLRGYPADWLATHPETLSSTKSSRLDSFPGLEIEQSRIRAVLGHDLRDQLSGISRQVLVVSASDDQITPLPFSDELTNMIPKSEQYVFETGGHFFPHVHPVKYAEVVSTFLRGDKA